MVIAIAKLQLPLKDATEVDHIVGYFKAGLPSARQPLFPWNHYINNAGK